MTFRNIIWKYEPRKDGSCAVKVYTHIKGKTKYFQVEGIYVLPKYWDDRQGRVKPTHPLSKIYNAKILELRYKIEEHFITGGDTISFNSKEKSHSLADLFEKYIDRSIKGESEQSSGTINNYKSTQKRILEFEEYMGKTYTVDDIDKEFEQDFISYMKGIKVSLTTIGLHFSRIKTRIRHDLTECQNTYFEKLPLLKERGKVQIFLNEEDIRKIESIQLSKPLGRQRDRFLICYYFLLRFSDANQISESSVVSSQEDKYLSIKAKKTGITQSGYISPKADSLLKKYNYDFNFTTNTAANLAIRRIANLANINEKINTPDGPVAKWELVNTHSARRSGATNLFLQGASIKLVADIGGWSNFNQLKKYLLATSLQSAKVAKQLKHFK